MDVLKAQGDAAHKKYAPEINKLYPGDTYKNEDFLKDVQTLMGYSK